MAPFELICQPPAEAIERRSRANADLRVPKERHYVQVHTHRFTVGAYLQLAQGTTIERKLILVIATTSCWSHPAAISGSARRRRRCR